MESGLGSLAMAHEFPKRSMFVLMQSPVLPICPLQKLVDGPLMAKWKKPGYERLCSTYVINTKNYKFGTVSICRVSGSKSRTYCISCQATGCLSLYSVNMARGNDKSTARYTCFHLFGERG